MQLALEGVAAGYGRRSVITGLSLALEAGAFVTMLGPNGAGKTTTARVIAGLLPARQGRITFEGRDITRLAPETRVARGMALVPQGREMFPAMSVLENLEMGAFARWKVTDRRAEMDRVFAVFPRLRERLAQLAGTLSGGEQQMLAIGRALMAGPRLLVLDEPSLGLAPRLVEEILSTIATINAGGTTVLLIEQNARIALDVARFGVVLEAGVIRLSGPTAELQSDPEVERTYLGIHRAPGAHERGT
jgi:branched-chain amino acid transport system ATP-binding protein